MRRSRTAWCSNRGRRRRPDFAPHAGASGVIDATPLLRAYARARLGRLRRQDSARTQERLLLSLLRTARATAFGAEHGFAGIGSVGDFQGRVPLRRHLDFWNEYWKDGFPRLTNRTWPGTVRYFAATSGTTTGTSKFVPCTGPMIQANRRGAIDLLVHHINNRPQSHVLGGKSFMLGGSTDLDVEAPGVRSGDISGIAAAAVPWWARSRYYPPPRLARISEWEDKAERLARHSRAQDIRVLGGTPSWLLLFIDRLSALMPDSDGRLAGIYPNLELLAHGGINFTPYRSRFAALLAGSRAELREVYAASEGFIAVADRGYGEGLRLIVDNGLFYEFVPVDELDQPNPVRHWLANAETEVNYALVLSSCAGVWSYVLGDTVRLIERSPPRVLITGRTSYTLSAFGEHLIDEEIEESVAAAAASIGAEVTDYCVAARFPEAQGERGGHRFMVEFAAVPSASRIDAFARDLDRALSATNDDYRVHRAEGFGLDPPLVQAFQPGTFAAWMKSRGKLGGQNKVPRIIDDAELLRDLRGFAEALAGAR